MAQLTDNVGRPIELGHLIGRGGEGSVHLVAGQPEMLAKIYLTPPDAERVQKITAMARRHDVEFETVCAWPRSVLYKNGTPLGLLMTRFDARQELHVLLGPKSRKQRFPDASFAFLVHVALNVARAIAWLHERRIFVGDLNDRGILVAPNGTVRLIDCDSFQLIEGTRVYGCDVGVPEYTAPELQGRSLRGIVRTANHDLFALAVLIFRILFMGRHPFAGRFRGGNKEIHEAIAECRYVYAKDPSHDMSPPPNMLAIETGAGALVPALFEAAFSRKASQSLGKERPSAQEWISALERLRQDLIDCPFNGAHQHVRGLASCPWCDLELVSNVDLFNLITTLDDNDPVPDVDAIWRALGALAVPHAAKLPDPSTIRVTPAPLPEPERLLRQQWQDAQQEAKRSRAALEAAVRKAAQARQAVETFVSLTPPDAKVTALQLRLKRLKGPERPRIAHRSLYMVGALTLYGSVVANSHALFILGALAFGAPTLIDWLIKGSREWWSRRVARKLSAAQLRTVTTSAALRLQLEQLQTEQTEAERDRDGAQPIADGLAEAAAVVQKTFDRAVKQRREDLERLAEAAETMSAASAARYRIARAKVETLEQDISQRRAALLPRYLQIGHVRSQRDQDVRRLKEGDRDQQLQAYLDQHYIAAASIDGITPGLKAALASYAIETAADVEKLNEIKVPGFGEVRTQRMMTWRNQVAAGFRFVPVQTRDPAKIKAIEHRYRADVRRIAAELSAALGDFETRIQEAQATLETARSTALEHATVYAQAKADLQNLK